MIRYNGTAASGGLATGRVKVINRRIMGFKRVVLAAHREKALYQAAVILAKDEIRRLMSTGEAASQDILNFQLVMLDDNGLNRMILGNIDSGKGGAEAVEMAMEEYCLRLKNTGDAYLSQRTSDIRDVLSRVVDILDGRSRERFVLKQPAIIVADEILPSDLASIERKYALGFVTVGGSYQSHANIIARTMGIPSVCGVEDEEILNPLNNGRTICLDGGTGEIVIAPDAEYEKKFAIAVHRQKKRRKKALRLKDRDVILPGGEKVSLFANCDDPRDIAAAIEAGAEGVGLVRSEILFMKDKFPTFEIQLNFYIRCIRAAKGLPITIRTFDIGADKPVKELDMPKEPNPALGVRGVRLQYSQRELFETQIRALYTAADAAGKVKAMIPMVSVKEDVADYLKMAQEVKSRLLARGKISRDNVSWGVMIETPAAALISDELAEMVDFFSIGTNDLTQYTLAADRLNSRTAGYFLPSHPSVLRLVKMTADSARQAGIELSVCGESAADPRCARLYVDLGIRTLSMAQSAIPAVKEKLIEGL